MSPKTTVRLGIGLVGVMFVMIVLAASFETVSTNHVAVGLRFGKVTGDVLDEGLHLVNPILDWDHFNCLEQEVTFKGITVPAEDQMKATMDVTVKGRFMPAHAVVQRRETGTQQQVIATHFQPIARGALREAGRSTSKVEEFYEDSKVEEYQSNALAILQEGLSAKGYEITDVIVRDVSLPEVITAAITAKKQREQEVEKQRAELSRIELVAEQKVKQAIADRDAAVEIAVAIRVTAEAEAYAIEVKKAELTDQYISFKLAEAWDGGLPKLMGSGVVPFLDLTAMTQ